MIETLQGCRIIFMFLIFMSHFTWMNSEEFCFGGDCGVSFFFMLSGFVLCHAHGKEVTDSRFGHKRFILRQLSKIYPLHIATLLATILIGMKAGIYPGIGNLALNITLLQSWIPDPDIHFGFNSVSWFLSDIMFFYLMFPSLVRCTMKAKKRHLTFGIAAVAAAYICILTAVPEKKTNSLLYVSPALRIIDFAIGIILYRLYKSDFTKSAVRRIKAGGKLQAGLIECVAIIMMIATYAVYQTTEERWRCASLFWLTMPVFIYIMATANATGGFVADILKSRTALWLSRLTMEIFMTHKIVIDVIKYILIKIGADPGYTATCLLCIGVTVATAYLTEKYFVRHTSNYLKRKIFKP